jgi:hypothetical protein
MVLKANRLHRQAIRPPVALHEQLGARAESLFRKVGVKVHDHLAFVPVGPRDATHYGHSLPSSWPLRIADCGLRIH